METNRQKDCETRLKRYTDTVSLIEPDRVPVIPDSTHFFPTIAAGMSYKDGMHDHQRYYDALSKMVLKYDFDMAQVSGVYSAQKWEALGLRNWKWPGEELPDDRPFQFQEREVMTADEYDDFLANPDGFTFRVLWPRIAKKLEPLASFPPLYYYFAYPDELGEYLADPAVVGALDAFKALGEAWKEHNRIKINCYQELEALGYPKIYDGILVPPFDVLSVWLRGSKGTFTDIFRNPGKMLAVIDLFTEMQIESGVGLARSSGNPRVMIYAYRGAGGFMSNTHFEKFYWPSLRKLITELLDKAVQPQLYFEGDANPRLPYLAELPKGKVPIHFDWVDRKEAKKYIANTNCYWGNIPVSLMEYGTAQQVEDDVKELIDLFASGGGLIVDCSGGLTDNAKPENVDAMVRTVHLYGKK
jgi:hypothetical protein